MDFRFPDNTLFSDLPFAGLKLGLHQTDPLAAYPQQAAEHRQHQGQRDKSHINRAEIKRLRDLLAGDIPDIGPLQIHDPLVCPQAPGQLPVADIHRIDPLCSVLEHAVGKAAGGGADIKTDLPSQIE